MMRFRTMFWSYFYRTIDFEQLADQSYLGSNRFFPIMEETHTCENEHRRKRTQICVRFSLCSFSHVRVLVKVRFVQCAFSLSLKLFLNPAMAIPIATLLEIH